ncbi:saccharopine dehydrogenase-like oxidoreductase [Tubulanus polymorphus]|uniref:saccharopine dehydrogenase-like oxidoreductase n=1 Tax=Tubulanus polymorphus TaxID=672921 RepID=UPI003DA55F39
MVVSRTYDIVIFGATGFTGQYVVEEVARIADEESGLTWAIAGRNREKMNKVLVEASKLTGKDLEKIPMILADVTEEQSIIDMCKQAKLILNTVGPYRFYGEKIVKACIDAQTHHIDISGEPQFLEKMQLLYNTKAKESSIYVVGACGWDSIPADMGVVYLQQNFDGDLNSVENFVGGKSGPKGGGVHFGTWQSAIYGFAHAGELKKLRSALFHNSRLPKSQYKIPGRNPISYSDEVSNWILPFPGSDKSVIQRTQRHIYYELEKKPVQFEAYYRVPSLFASLVVAFCAIVFGILAKFSFGRSLLEKYPRIFSLGMFSHEGPTREQVQGASFSMTFIGKGWDTKLPGMEDHKEPPNKTMVLKITGPEPGYIATSTLMVQAAVVVLKETSKLPPPGGVLTPGIAFAQTSLVERLSRRNIHFKIEK